MVRQQYIDFILEVILNANGEIVWAGNSYQRFPIEATGFAYQRGQIPRPKLIVSNALGTISAILIAC